MNIVIQKILSTVFIIAIISQPVLFCACSKSNDPVNVILISIDTCRADHLSCYGHKERTTPNIDAIAAEGILFENAVSPSPLTLPSHATMLTGTIPPWHGIHDNSGYRLAESSVTLTEKLKEGGYVTGAFIGSYILDSKFGLAQGFDVYSDEFPSPSEAGLDHSNTIPAAEVSKRAVSWLENQKGSNFFLFLHYYDPHAPYEPPPPYREEYATNPYSGEIAYTDHCVGQVIDKLKQLDCYDSSLIIVTSDHGESLYEHKEGTHGYFIYQSTLHVPLIIKLPHKNEAKKIHDTVGLEDLTPTILSLLDMTVPAESQGEDVSYLIMTKNHENRESYYYCESMYPVLYDANPLMGIVHNNWKYILSNRPELYNLKDDPVEENNLIENNTKIAKSLKKKLFEILEEDSRADTDDSKLELDQDSLDRIKALGYVGGGIKEEFAMEPGKQDAKDLIELHEGIQLVDTLISDNQFPRAETLIKEMMERWPGHAVLYRTFGHHYYKKEEFEKAVQSYSRYFETISSKKQPINTEYISAVNEYSSASIRLGKGEQSLELLKRVLELDPESHSTLINLGIVYSMIGNPANAEKYFQKALQVKATADALLNFALLLAKKKNFHEAADHYEKAVILDPAKMNPFALSTLAEGLFQNNDYSRSLKYYLELQAIDPTRLQTQFRIANLYELLGHQKKAVEYYKSILEIRPEWTDPKGQLAWILATSQDSSIRDASESIRLAMEICDTAGSSNPLALNTLAAAYAANRQFNKAIEAVDQALNMLNRNGQKELIQALEEHRELYIAGKPLIED